MECRCPQGRVFLPQLNILETSSETPRGLISKYLQTLLSWQMSWAIIIPSRNLHVMLQCCFTWPRSGENRHQWLNTVLMSLMALRQPLQIADVFCPWYCYTIQNHSAYFCLYEHSLFFSCLIKIFVFLSGLSKNWPGGKNSSWHLRKIAEPGTFWDTGPRRIW